MTVLIDTVPSDTIGLALRRGAAVLAAAGIDEPRREARLLLGAAAAITATETLAFPERRLARSEAERFAALLARRARREPTARLLGRREFWSLDFALSSETLVPRPDSETVIEAALAQLPDRTMPRRVLDLGTGSGCLLLALLSELPAATGIGVDVAPGAAATARRNAAALGLSDRARFLVGYWAAALASEEKTARFDVILANPPYIASAAIADLAPEVACHEPRHALDGGADGLSSYREIAPQAAALLAEGGFLAIEIGAGQEEAVTRILAAAGLARTRVFHDLAGIPRCIVAGRETGATSR